MGSVSLKSLPFSGLLSDLIINANKDWLEYDITNIGDVKFKAGKVADFSSLTKSNAIGLGFGDSLGIFGEVGILFTGGDGTSGIAFDYFADAAVCEIKPFGSVLLGTPSSFFDEVRSAKYGTYNAVLTGTNAVGFGFEAQAIGLHSVCLGFSGVGYGAIGNYSLAIGTGAKATGEYSIAIGQGCEALADTASSFGIASVASGEGSIAITIAGSATGNYSQSFGLQTVASGLGATAIGYNLEASANFAIALGQGFNNSTPNSLEIGFSNVPIVKMSNTQCYFGRTNPFRVSSDGYLFMAHRLYHEGNTGTYVEMTFDQQKIYCGGRLFMSYIEASTDKGVFNDDNNDVDLYVKTRNNSKAIWSEAGKDAVHFQAGIGYGIKEVDLNYNQLNDDYILFAYRSGTLQLTKASTKETTRLTIIKGDAVGTCRIAAYAGEEINGISFFNLTSIYESVTIETHKFTNPSAPMSGYGWVIINYKA